MSENAWKYLGPVIELKTHAEDYLMTSGLETTILRPGGMRSDAPSGTAVKTEDHTIMGTINRAELIISARRRAELERVRTQCTQGPGGIGTRAQ